MTDYHVFLLILLALAVEFRVLLRLQQRQGDETPAPFFSGWFLVVLVAIALAFAFVESIGGRIAT